MANSVDPDCWPTDLDLHCLQRQGISVFSRTRVDCITDYLVINESKEICFICFIRVIIS